MARRANPGPRTVKTGAAGSVGDVLRRWFSPRSMMWHALLIIIVGGCCYAAWWQFHRAADGNTLSYLYSIEWPAFAIVAVIGWWQLVTEKPEDFQARREARRQAALPKPVAYDTEVLRRELAAHPELVQAFPELVRAFPELGAAGGELASGNDSQLHPAGPAGPAAEVAAPSGAPPTLLGPDGDGVDERADDAGLEGASLEGGRLEGGRLEGGRLEGGRLEGGRLEGGRLEGNWAPAPSAEVQAYNRVLGDLAARGKAKTWRNPRGKA